MAYAALRDLGVDVQVVTWKGAEGGTAPADGDPGDGATAEQPAGRGEDEQPKRKKPRRGGNRGRTGWTRDHDDD